MENSVKNKKVVISASVSQGEEIINKWIKYWKSKRGIVIKHPTKIEKNKLLALWPKVHKDFYKSLSRTDIHFIANEDKDNYSGYVGVGTFAEFAFSVGLNLSRDKKIDILIYKIPDQKSIFYKDIIRWLKLGWIKLLKK
jgi:hypothetical protein